MAPTLNALSLNPFNWFEDNDSESISLATGANQELAAAQLAIAKEKYEAGNLSSAKRTLKKLIKKYPTSSSAGEALAMRARIYMTKELWTKGFNDLQRVIVEHADYENFDRVIADYNVRHAREVTGEGAGLDLYYMRFLGPDAVPALRWFQSHATLSPSRAQDAERMADKIAKEIETETQANWRAWTWRRQRMLDAAAEQAASLPQKLLGDTGWTTEE